MTEAQWNSIQADIAAIRTLLFALAKTCPDSAALRVAFQAQKELLNTALIHSPLSEEAIRLQQREVLRMETAIWG